MKRKHWIALLSIALALLVAGGSVTAWLLTRTPPDTDPDAPFEDLSQWEKRQILRAVNKELEGYYSYQGYWYGDTKKEDDLASNHHGSYGCVAYHGTFNGYHIVMVTFQNPTGGPWLDSMECVRLIGEYRFYYKWAPFELFAYKTGSIINLREAYSKELFSDAYMVLIQQCFHRNNEEVYIVANGENES